VCPGSFLLELSIRSLSLKKKLYPWHLSRFFSFLKFGGTGVWTQCLILAKQTLCQPFFVLSIFEIGFQTVCMDWLWIVILLLSASRVPSIIGVSHQCPAPLGGYVLKLYQKYHCLLPGSPFLFPIQK
jgi:hypothetical protein